MLARAAGREIPADPDLTFGEPDEHNPFGPVEQMMPFRPMVRLRDVDEAIAKAKYYEHGFRHTAIIHTTNVHNMTKMGRVMDTTLFVKNGPSMSALGLDGEGYLSFSIATPTGEGVTKLALWFRGDSGNAAERMFVALNGNAVVYHEDASASQTSRWTEWAIDLQAFAGVNLGNVNTVTIGLGTKNSPAAGGTGTMYFDDIRLVR